MMAVVCVAQVERSDGRTPEQQQLRVRQTAAQLRHDGIDAGHGVLRRPVQPAQIVGADQDHRRLRRNAGYLAVLDAPQQM